MSHFNSMSDEAARPERARSLLGTSWTARETLQYLRPIGTAEEASAVPTCRQLALIGAGVSLLVIIGAAIFTFLERSAAIEARNEFERQLEELRAIGNFTSGQSVVVAKMLALQGLHSRKTHLAIEDPWSFTSSLYFTLVLISSVGYGDLAPETGFGKMAAVLVSFIGLPLLLSFILPLARQFVDSLTGLVRRWYITRAVERAMEAVELSSNNRRGSSARVDYNRRVPDASGVGLSREDVDHVELASVLLILLLLLLSITVLAPLLSSSEGWAIGDAYTFIWYTVTTIGLGDMTMRLRRPLMACSVLLFLLFAGTVAARSLVSGTQRAAAVLELRISQATRNRGGHAPFREIVDRLADGAHGHFSDVDQDAYRDRRPFVPRCGGMELEQVAATATPSSLHDNPSLLMGTTLLEPST